MNNPVFDDKGRRDDEDETPLDPATARVQTKLRRLLAGSSLVMVAGFVAVFAAILYKVNSASTPASGAIAATIALPSQAHVEDIELSGGRLIVLIREGEAAAILHYDATSGALIGRTDLVSR